MSYYLQFCSENQAQKLESILPVEIQTQIEIVSSRGIVNSILMRKDMAQTDTKKISLGIDAFWDTHTPEPPRPWEIGGYNRN